MAAYIEVAVAQWMQVIKMDSAKTITDLLEAIVGAFPLLAQVDPVTLTRGCTIVNIPVKIHKSVQ